MDTKTRFELNEAIQKWQENLRSKGSLCEDDIEELHSHLLDQIEALNAQGLNEEEAFLIARKRLGCNEVLRVEYEKVNVKWQWRKKLSLLFLGMIAYLMLSSLLEIMQKSAFVIASYFTGTTEVSLTMHSLVFSAFIMGLVVFIKYGHHVWKYLQTKWINSPVNMAVYVIFFSILLMLFNRFLEMYYRLSIDIEMWGKLAMHKILFNIALMISCYLVFFVLFTRTRSQELLFRRANIRILLVLSLMASLLVCFSFASKNYMIPSTIGGIVFAFFGFCFGLNERFGFMLKQLILLTPMILIMIFGMVFENALWNSLCIGIFGCCTIGASLLGQLFGEMYRKGELSLA